MELKRFKGGLKKGDYKVVRRDLMTKVSIVICIWDWDGNMVHPNIVRLCAMGTTKGEEEDDEKNSEQLNSKSLQNTGGDGGGGNGLVPSKSSFILIGGLKYTLCNNIYR